MKLILVGFEFESSNEGCEAFSYSVIFIINSIEALEPLTVVNIKYSRFHQENFEHISEY